jgi:SAM-dependent methyltransferase
MLYDYPEYYEKAFAFRDIPLETSFMEECMSVHSGVEVGRILELACGQAPHAGELLSRGYDYVGLDTNPRMLSYAHSRWLHLTRRPELVQGNLVDFRLPRRADFAYVMMGSLYLTGQDQLASHFDTMARALNPGGLYFMDWCLQFFDPLQIDEGNRFDWEKDGLQFRSRFEIRLLDPGQHIYEEIWTMDIEGNGHRRHFTMVEQNMALFPRDFLEFVDSRDDFEFVGWWREWDLDKPINGDLPITRPLVLLRRTSR